MSSSPELPHDLVEIVRPEALACDAPAPEWVRHGLAQTPVVVVRRAPARDGLLPVGVRGTTRNQRFGAWVAPRDIVKRIRPEDLAIARAWCGRRSVPQLASLDAVAGVVESLGLSWGPVGSAGFELATGLPCVGPASDLDLVVRAPGEMARDDARRLLAAFAALSIAVDVQMETPRGAISLAEYASGTDRVVLRTIDGPMLVSNAWAAATTTAAE